MFSRFYWSATLKFTVFILNEKLLDNVLIINTRTLAPEKWKFIYKFNFDDITWIGYFIRPLYQVSDFYHFDMRIIKNDRNGPLKYFFSFLAPRVVIYENFNYIFECLWFTPCLFRGFLAPTLKLTEINGLPKIFHNFRFFFGIQYVFFLLAKWKLSFR